MIHDLTRWAIHQDSRGCGPYSAPEQYATLLSGLCPTRAAEVNAFLQEPLTTSPVVSYNPVTKIVTTRSGTQYRLVGEPSDEYVAWCHKDGVDTMRALTALVTS